MLRLYSDENFPQPVVEELRRLGYDVLTSLQAGQADQAIEDEKVLAFALAEGRATLTNNRKHFVHLHPKVEHAGIIVCSFDPDFVGQAKRIDELIKSESDLSGQLIRVNRPQK